MCYKDIKMKKIWIFILVIVVLVIGGLAYRYLQSSSQAPGRELQMEKVFQQLNQPPSCEDRGGELLVITSQSDWDEFLEECYKDQPDLFPIPEINFAEKIVVAYLVGHNISGDNYELNSISLKNGKLLVDYTVKKPGKGCLHVMGGGPEAFVVKVEKVEFSEAVLVPHQSSGEPCN